MTKPVRVTTEAAAVTMRSTAAAHCEDAVGILRAVFPSNSTMVAHEEAKLGRLRFNCRPDATAAAVLKRAAATLEIISPPPDTATPHTCACAGAS